MILHTKRDDNRRQNGYGKAEIYPNDRRKFLEFASNRDSGTDGQKDEILVVVQTRVESLEERLS
jgi:hypothetical protein